MALLFKVLRQEVLEVFLHFGHAGVSKTLAILDQCQYKWPGVYTDVKKYVSSCEQCATCKRGLPKRVAKIKSLETPPRCGEIFVC